MNEITETAIPAAPGLVDARWFKASASTTSNGCVEVAFLARGRVALRDSKHPDAPAHVFTAHEWACFLDGARRGEFDLPAGDGAFA